MRGLCSGGLIRRRLRRYEHKDGLALLFKGLRFFFFVFGGFFDGKVSEFGGVEDLSAGLALYEFGVLVSGDDLYDGVFAGGGHGWQLGSWMVGFCRGGAGLSTREKEKMRHFRRFQRERW